MYVIIKTGKWYRGGAGYNGPVCEQAKIEPGKVYATEKKAVRDMDALNKIKEGFKVVLYHPPFLPFHKSVRNSYGVV